VVVLDTLAAGLAFVSAETTSRAGRCPACGYNDSLGVWIVGHVVVGTTVRLEITVRVVGTGEVTNTAEIIENHLPDRNGDNDIASATITVSSSTQAKATAAEDEAGVPEVFALRQNYPNPFNPETVIGFELPEGVYVRLVVYDAMGREVARLVDGSLGVGRHAVRWEAGGLPSGAYLYRMTAGSFSVARVMVLLR